MGRAIVREPKRVPDGRAALEPRREAARADARRHRGAAGAARRDDGLRHARPVRGDDARPSRRGAEGRPPAAVRRAARAVRAAGEHVRRRLHRLALDEPLRRCRSARTGRAPSAASIVAAAGRALPVGRAAGAGRRRPAAGVARARAGRDRAPRSRSSRRSAPTRTSSAPPSSAARRRSSSPAQPRGAHRSAARASRSARSPARRICSSRSAAPAWPEPAGPGGARQGPVPSTGTVMDS